MREQDNGTERVDGRSLLDKLYRATWDGWPAVISMSAISTQQVFFDESWSIDEQEGVVTNSAPVVAGTKVRDVTGVGLERELGQVA